MSKTKRRGVQSTSRCKSRHKKNSKDGEELENFDELETKSQHSDVVDNHIIEFIGSGEDKYEEPGSDDINSSNEMDSLEESTIEYTEKGRATIELLDASSPLPPYYSPEYIEEWKQARILHMIRMRQLKQEIRHTMTELSGNVFDLLAFKDNFFKLVHEGVTISNTHEHTIAVQVNNQIFTSIPDEEYKSDIEDEDTVAQNTDPVVGKDFKHMHSRQQFRMDVPYELISDLILLSSKLYRKQSDLYWKLSELFNRIFIYDDVAEEVQKNQLFQTQDKASGHSDRVEHSPYRQLAKSFEDLDHNFDFTTIYLLINQYEQISFDLKQKELSLKDVEERIRNPLFKQIEVQRRRILDLEKENQSLKEEAIEKISVPNDSNRTDEIPEDHKERSQDKESPDSYFQIAKKPKRHKGKQEGDQLNVVNKVLETVVQTSSINPEINNKTFIVRDHWRGLMQMIDDRNPQIYSQINANLVDYDSDQEHSTPEMTNTSSETGRRAKILLKGLVQSISKLQSKMHSKVVQKEATKDWDETKKLLGELNTIFNQTNIDSPIKMVQVERDDGIQQLLDVEVTHEHPITEVNSIYSSRFQTIAQNNIEDLEAIDEFVREHISIQDLQLSITNTQSAETSNQTSQKKRVEVVSVQVQTNDSYLRRKVSFPEVDTSSTMKDLQPPVKEALVHDGQFEYLSTSATASGDSNTYVTMMNQVKQNYESRIRELEDQVRYLEKRAIKKKKNYTKKQDKLDYDTHKSESKNTKLSKKKRAKILNTAFVVDEEARVKDRNELHQPGEDQSDMNDSSMNGSFFLGTTGAEDDEEEHVLSPKTEYHLQADVYRKRLFQSSNTDTESDEGDEYNGTIELDETDSAFLMMLTSDESRFYYKDFTRRKPLIPRPPKNKPSTQTLRRVIAQRRYSSDPSKFEAEVKGESIISNSPLNSRQTSPRKHHSRGGENSGGTSRIGTAHSSNIGVVEDLRYIWDPNHLSMEGVDIGSDSRPRTSSFPTSGDGEVKLPDIFRRAATKLVEEMNEHELLDFLEYKRLTQYQMHTLDLTANLKRMLPSPLMRKRHTGSIPPPRTPPQIVKPD